MQFNDNVYTLNELISVLFAVFSKEGSKVIFRYPHEVDNRNEDNNIQTGVFKRKNTSFSNITPHQLLDTLYDSTLQSLLVPKQSKFCGKPFYVEIDSLVFVGNPFQVEADDIAIYNIIFVIQKGTSTSVINSLINLSKRMSIAFAHEESNCQYISKSVDEMLRHYNEDDVVLRDDVDLKDIDEEDVIIEHCPFSKMINDESTFAHTLSDVFESIRSACSAKVSINNVINFSFFIDKNSEDEQAKMTIAPFESFVLLKDSSTIKDSLNYDSSPALIKLIELQRPYFRNIKDIAIHLELEYEEVQEAVVALVRWRKALILYPIVSTNEYMLSDLVPISRYPEFNVLFRKEFPTFHFYTELSKFSERVNLSEILDFFQDKETIDSYKSMVVWFLQHQLLVQLFAHVYIRPPKTDTFVLRRPSRSSSQVADEESVDDKQEALTQPSHASLTRGIIISDHEREKILHKYLSKSQIARLKEIKRNYNSATLNDFAKILPHAHAGLTIEEILWRTNMQRSEICGVTEAFNEFLITIKHPH